MCEPVSVPLGQLVEDRAPHVFEVRRHGGRSPLVGVKRFRVADPLGPAGHHTLSTGSDPGPTRYPHGCPQLWKIDRPRGGGFGLQCVRVGSAAS